MSESSVSSLSILRQIGLMVGLAASVALGVVLVLWSQEPEKRPLGDMDRATTYEVVSYLEQNKIAYEIGPTGAVFVDQGQYQRVQMALASQGIADTMSGDSILQSDSGFGVSQQLENARLVRSKEKSLSSTIVKFAGISQAEVHLAIPKQTVFVTDRRKPSASVLLNLSSTMPLDSQQTRAIVDLVAGSVPSLTPDRITITDQYGRLMHSGSMSPEESQSRQQFEDENKRQQALHTKIEKILSPILGMENFSVQVNVRMSFIKNETTSKFHNPDAPSLVSERKLTSSNVDSNASGVPGALSNQPPGAANIPETNAGSQATGSASSGNQHSESEANYELDTTINHTRYQTANIDRISVSVGLNNLLDENGERLPRSAAEIQRIERLIKGVINFDAARGDSVVIDSFNFNTLEEPPEPAPLEFYEQELFKMLIKPAVALVGVLLLILFVFRPVISKLTTGTMQLLDPEYNPSLANDQLSLGGDMGGGMALPPMGRKSLAQVDRAKSAVGDDPAMVAQVVKSWMETDEQ